MNEHNFLVIPADNSQDDISYVQALEATLKEWNSELDEEAFSDLQSL